MHNALLEIFIGCVQLAVMKCKTGGETSTVSRMDVIWIEWIMASQPVFIWSKLTIKTLEQGAKYVQS